MPREMKDSGFSWIGEVPNSWKVVPVKVAFSEVKTKNSDGAITNALKFKFGEIVPKSNFDSETDDYVADTILNYTIVEPRTIMINGLNLNYDFKTLRTGLVKEKGIITSAYLALKPDENIIWAEYATYLFKGYETKMAFHNMGSGIRLTLGFKEFKNQQLLLPTFPEQKTIADFLDKQCAEIDAVIEHTKATIEEYKALKQSVITEAVTKGIRGDRPMKDSGIEWTDFIAETWNMSRIGLHFNVILGKMLCDKQINEEYTLEPYFCAANVHFDGISQADLKQMWFSPSEKSTYCVKNGDLLVVEGGAGAGGSAIVTNLIAPTYVQNSVMIVRNKKNADNRFLKYWIEMLVRKGYIDVVCNKATIPHFTKDKLSTMPYPILCNDEEIEISDYLDQKCAEIDTLIEKKTALLEEMEALKKSIIFEYVTGKKEVV